MRALVAGLGFFAVALALRVYTVMAVAKNEAAYPPLGQFVEVNGLRLHYVRKGSGTPVVLLHGNAGSVHDFTLTIFDRLTANFDAIAFDRPGHGFSDRPATEILTPSEQAEILHKALSILGIKAPIIVGYSWSGALALAYAVAYPKDLAGLVLLAPVAYPDPAFDTALFKVAQLPLLGDFITGSFVMPFSTAIARPSLEAAFAPDPAPIAYTQIATALWLRPNQVKAMAQDVGVLNSSLKQVSPHYKQINVPTIIVTGDADRLDPPQLHAIPLHNAIQSSKLIVIPGAGHMLPHSQSSAVLEAICALAGLTGGSSGTTSSWLSPASRRPSTRAR
jgi:pimeloyl-ACP methyl ester carboxylesterase